MIEPTVGRIVWCYQYDRVMDKIVGPLAAIITDVLSPYLVNLCIFGADRGCFFGNRIRLIQEDEKFDDADKKSLSNWCEWMPYQKGQAQKTEALEAKLNEKL